MSRAAIGYVHPGAVRAEFMQSVLGVVRDGATDVEDVLGVRSGANISRARNLLVDGFLGSCRAEWLWMVDSDMVFTADALDALIGSADPVERPIISGLYFRPSDVAGDAPVPVLFGSAELPENDCVTVDATGAGCLLVHRDAFEAIAKRYDPPAPWFFETIENEKYYGEDVNFCRRAKSTGLSVYVNTGVQVGHVKYATVGKVQTWQK
jgi:GT2 family glycosyltransferase